ncbi:MAG: hypothetical protein ACLT4E_14195 [Clostridium sp.]
MAGGVIVEEGTPEKVFASDNERTRISLVGMGICCRGYAFIYILKNVQMHKNWDLINKLSFHVYDSRGSLVHFAPYCQVSGKLARVRSNSASNLPLRPDKIANECLLYMEGPYVIVNKKCGQTILLHKRGYLSGIFIVNNVEPVTCRISLVKIREWARIVRTGTA